MKSRFTSEIILSQYNSTHNTFASAIRSKLNIFVQLTNTTKRDNCWNAYGADRDDSTGILSRQENKITNAFFYSRQFLSVSLEELETTIRADVDKWEDEFRKCNNESVCVVDYVSICIYFKFSHSYFDNFFSQFVNNFRPIIRTHRGCRAAVVQSFEENYKIIKQTFAETQNAVFGSFTNMTSCYKS